MSEAAKRAKHAFAAVRRILWEDWDPIGACVPEDEYDSYAWPVLALLHKGAGRDELEVYLRWAADESMQCPVPEAKLSIVVDQLMALDVG